MRVLLCRPDELGPNEIAAWQSMQRSTASLANPFLSLSSPLAVGRFRPAARVAVLYDGQSIAGFFPFERRWLSAGVPICAWPGTLCQGSSTSRASTGTHGSSSGAGLSVWQFDHLVAGQKPFERYQAARPRRRSSISATDSPRITRSWRRSRHGSARIRPACS